MFQTLIIACWARLCDTLSAVEHPDESDNQPDGTSMEIVRSRLRVELLTNDRELVKGGNKMVSEGCHTDVAEYGYYDEQQGVDARRSRTSPVR